MTANESIDTIFALSSGAGPAALGIIRITGPAADAALLTLAGRLPDYRRASLMRLIDAAAGDLLDEALVLRFAPGASATGENVVELHCHGGRAVVAAIERALGALPTMRRAEPGEFTRRAFAHGLIGLNEAEGLADLLSAETEGARRDAVARAGGAMGAALAAWQRQLLALSASVEAELDFADEGDVAGGGVRRTNYAVLLDAINALLARPPAERLRDGLRIAIGGPPNSGKSTLLNALVSRDAAIVSPLAGTTRDVIEVPVALRGIPYVFIDTAGLRTDTADIVEEVGVARANAVISTADLLLWLGPEGQAPTNSLYWEISAQSDRADASPKSPSALRLSALTGDGMDGLLAALHDWARTAMPPTDGQTLTSRLRAIVTELRAELSIASAATDPLLEAEHLRIARAHIDRLTGQSGTEDMLDALFGRFCIGK